jgi:hypothetical protein
VKHVRVPIKEWNGDRWGALCLLTTSPTFELIAEAFDQKDAKFSFVGGHRVRLYKLKKNVHFKVPPEVAGVDLDISSIQPGATPPRRPQR